MTLVNVTPGRLVYEELTWRERPSQQPAPGTKGQTSEWGTCQNPQPQTPADE